MPISPWWLQGAILTYLFGFTVLGVLAYLAWQERPPIPGRVVDSAGATVFTGEDVRAGMDVFQRYGLMEYGSVYGHGSYLGPDYTADYLHRSAEALTRAHAAAPTPAVSPREEVIAELHANTWDPTRGTITWSDARAEAHRALVAHYAGVFDAERVEGGLQARLIPDPEAVRTLTAFFAWTAWTATADRPGVAWSYTNNWPPEPAAGNQLTGSALVWSAISIIGLLGGMGIVLWFFGRYDWLGWQRSHGAIRIAPPGELALTPAQRRVVWFLVVASALFLVQTFAGGLLAHTRAEPNGFFGVDLSRFLPFNVARTWHVQLALFWVSASYLATGIFITPFIAGVEPRGQGKLTILLLSAVTVVVVGSLAGEYAGVSDWLQGRSWFWFGHQGLEYLDLGRLWQILLIVGLFLWTAILWRGLRPRLRAERHGNLPWLFFYAALAIPTFYAAGLLADNHQGFVIQDFWRFWVVHLWVEDFLELFTTVVVAYMFVLLGMVREETAIRVIYLDIVLYSAGGVIGTMHHLYFSGTPEAHLALGAAFSAMEVIPLLLLTLEAWGFLRAGERSGVGEDNPHRWSVWFLVAVGVWNFLGAGVFGFLINLPAVSYFEIGTGLTANHAHTAMMGVYGMLAVGLLLFCLRYAMRPEAWSDRAAKAAFWSLNIGLAWMAFVNLFPMGIAQLNDALTNGYWHARSPAFQTQGWVNVIEWARLPGDALFILGCAVPILWLCVQALRFPNRTRLGEGEATPRLYEE